MHSAAARGPGHPVTSCHGMGREFQPKCSTTRGCTGHLTPHPNTRHGNWPARSWLPLSDGVSHPRHIQHAGRLNPAPHYRSEGRHKAAYYRARAHYSVSLIFAFRGSTSPTWLREILSPSIFVVGHRRKAANRTPGTARLHAACDMQSCVLRPRHGKQLTRYDGLPRPGRGASGAAESNRSVK